MIWQDSFYYDLTEEKMNHVHEYNFDHPDAFDIEHLLYCVEKLRHGQAVDVPNYDFRTYKRNLSSRKVNTSDVIILEGILVFHDPRVREMMNMKIFVDADADVRLARRIKRDTLEKGRDIKTILDQEDAKEYSKFVKPAFDDFILPTKKYADIIVPYSGDNYVVEHGLGHLPFNEKQIITPTGIILFKYPMGGKNVFLWHKNICLIWNVVRLGGHKSVSGYVELSKTYKE
ncbi:hypothetical protein ZIOFF_012363 [Zingiber officinale]|uniref:uridine/cytidine kinase n=1 Tax=Zingiber officinale TaxID=94328 RepID=A0A8J5HPZ8_ZINOF|nr:hypothetical protein ZIOFF_012363 [Zingiber officinale]